MFTPAAAAAAATSASSAGSTSPRPRSSGLLDREQARLDGTGRLLVRASGTEPVIRVMVEAEDEALLADVLRDRERREIAALARRPCLSRTSPTASGLS